MGPLDRDRPPPLLTPTPPPRPLPPSLPPSHPLPQSGANWSDTPACRDQFAPLCGGRGGGGGGEVRVSDIWGSGARPRLAPYTAKAPRSKRPRGLAVISTNCSSLCRRRPANRATTDDADEATWRTRRRPSEPEHRPDDPEAQRSRRTGELPADREKCTGRAERQSRADDAVGQRPEVALPTPIQVITSRPESHTALWRHPQPPSCPEKRSASRSPRCWPCRHPVGRRHLRSAVPDLISQVRPSRFPVRTGFPAVPMT